MNKLCAYILSFNNPFASNKKANKCKSKSTAAANDNTFNKTADSIHFTPNTIYTISLDVIETKIAKGNRTLAAIFRIIKIFFFILSLSSCIWLNDGNGLFTDSEVELQTMSGLEEIHLADLNADSLLDIIVINSENPDELFFNDGDLAFTKSTQTFGLDTWNGCGSIDIGDLKRIEAA